MPRRNSYIDTATGEFDSNIRELLNGENTGGLKSLLLNIIKNELTARQKEIIMLYYFKGLDMNEIADRLNISIQAVSAVMARGRKRIFKILRYYMEADYENTDI